jgi:hypothetical protein
MHKITSLLAALALTACSVHVDSQYGLRLEPRRVVRPEAEVPKSTESARPDESVASLAQQDYSPAETTAQPESLLEAPASELQSNEPELKKRWVLEIPHEEIPAIAQPLVEHMAYELNTPKDSATSTRVDNRASKTIIRVVFGVLLICASLLLGLVGFAFWVIEETATYLILALVLFLGGTVLLFVGI